MIVDRPWTTVEEKRPLISKPIYVVGRLKCRATTKRRVFFTYACHAEGTEIAYFGIPADNTESSSYMQQLVDVTHWKPVEYGELP